jgi:hypothetical protein
MILVIDLSQKLLSKAGEAEQFQDVSHELAHILDFAIRGTSGHDQHWQNLHALMGGDGKRCHEYDLSAMRNRVKRVLLTDTTTGKTWLLTKHRYKLLYNNLILHNLSTPGKFKTQWLSPEQVLAYIATKKT